MACHINRACMRMDSLRPSDATTCSSSFCVDDVRDSMPLFRGGCGGAIPTSTLQLKFRSCPLKWACDLNNKWHSRLPNASPGNMQVHPSVAYVAECDDIAYAVAIWSRPCSPSLNDKKWIELRRLAIASDAPKNTATRMLGWMIRDIQKRFPDIEKAVSYQDSEVHQGTIYKAAGWVHGFSSNRTRWDKGRDRNEIVAKGEKHRWERNLQ